MWEFHTRKTLTQSISVNECKWYSRPSLWSLCRNRSLTLTRTCLPLEKETLTVLPIHLSAAKARQVLALQVLSCFYVLSDFVIRCSHFFPFFPIFSHIFPHEECHMGLGFPTTAGDLKGCHALFGHQQGSKTCQGLPRGIRFSYQNRWGFMDVLNGCFKWMFYGCLSVGFSWKWSFLGVWCMDPWPYPSSKNEVEYTNIPIYQYTNIPPPPPPPPPQPAPPWCYSGGGLIQSGKQKMMENYQLVSKRNNYQLLDFQWGQPPFFGKCRKIGVNKTLRKTSN